MRHVAVDYSTWCTREPDGDDWDQGDFDGQVNRVFIAPSDYFKSYNGFDTELEPPFYAIYASYYTGSTFGSEFTACVVGVESTLESAETLANEARKFDGFGQLSNGFYVPWTGYFESLIEIVVEGLL